MNVKKFAPLALALLLGLVAAKLAFNFISHKPNVSTATAEMKLITVVVAKHEIGPAQPLTADDVTLQAVARDNTAPDTFTNPTDVVDRVTAAPIIQGQVITPSLLIPKGMSPGLSAILPTGMRAITVSINEITGVGGYIQPGCHVDIIESIGRDADGRICLPIAQNIKVLAVGGRLNPTPPDGQGPATPVGHVTLLVTPIEAQRIQLAVASGQPSMVLRGEGDNARISKTGVTVADLVLDDGPGGVYKLFASILAHKAGQPTPTDTAAVAAAPAPPAPTTHTITEIRAGQVSTVTVKSPPPATQPVIVEASTGNN